MRTPTNETAADLTAHEPALPPEGGDDVLEDGDAEGSHARSRRDRACEPERTCVLTRTAAPAHTLIRLALGPDGTVHPDALARAGGRGAWVGVTRDELTTAQAKGKLKGVLTRAFKTGEFALPDDLPARIESALERATLDRLGMEARASTLLTGSSRIEEAARSGAVALLLHAADARPDGRRSLDQAWRVGSDAEGSGQQGIVLPVDRDRLSVALGRDNTVHVAVIEDGAATRVGRLLDRWRHYLGSTTPIGDALAARPADDDDGTMGQQ